MVWLYLNSAMVESWIGQGTSWAKIHGKERLLVDPADTSKVAFRWASWHGSWSSVDSWGLSRIIRWQRILSVSLYGADRQSECASLEVEFVWWWLTRWWIHFFKKIFSYTWGNDPVWRAYFSTWVVQPPTRLWDFPEIATACATNHLEVARTGDQLLVSQRFFYIVLYCLNSERQCMEVALYQRQVVRFWL